MIPLTVTQFIILWACSTLLSTANGNLQVTSHCFKECKICMETLQTESGLTPQGDCDVRACITAQDAKNALQFLLRSGMEKSTPGSEQGTRFKNLIIKSYDSYLEKANFRSLYV